jgi:dynein assembly factor 1
MAFMTKQGLLEICKEHKLYRTPSLNDKLYLNFKGFAKIDCLEEYTALRALFLEGNALDSIEGLPELKELRCLCVRRCNFGSCIFPRLYLPPIAHHA